MDNVSQIRMFFLSGLNEIPNQRVALFCLTLLCYCMILLLNITFIMTIVLDKNLHEPMYIILCTLCLNQLYGTAGLYPKFLWDLLSPVHVISYSGCLVQAHVMGSYVCCDLSILAVISYDRYVAICRPLQYHSIMSKRRLIKLVCYSWITPFCTVTTIIFLTSRVKLCSSYIGRFFCVNFMVVRLACFPAEIAINNIAVYIAVIIYAFHGLFIVVSYMHLIKICAKSIENRAKFMQTCVPHLMSVLTFIVVTLFEIMNMRFGPKDLPQGLQNFLAIVFLVAPPIINPLIYCFKLTKVRIRILGVITGVICNIQEHFSTLTK